MSKQLLKTLTLILAVVFLAGCTGGGVKARSYVTVKDRVDQNMENEGYNYGYLSGTPVPEDRETYRKTRKVYVMEFTKEAKEEDLPSYQPPPRRSAPAQEPIRVKRTRPEPEPQGIVIPDFDDEEYFEEEADGAGQFEDYVIQKGDTLQKISKKFYDSYSKWTKIYDINKNVIKDPNRIKPGISIRIPVQ